MRALSRALRRGQKGLERVDLESCALSVSQCDKMLTKCIEGEMRMTENSGHPLPLARSIGIEESRRALSSTAGCAAGRLFPTTEE